MRELFGRVSVDNMDSQAMLLLPGKKSEVGHYAEAVDSDINRMDCKLCFTIADYMIKLYASLLFVDFR